MAPTDQSLFTTAARLATFHSEHRLEKRRASSQKKKSPNTVAWPHNVPTPEDLSRAGFYYNPTPDSNDNVSCFLCEVKLDGWEVGDIPLDEHLAHAKACPWAVSLSCAREGEDRDPMDALLVDARTSTYADSWPHEKKKGWKPKMQKMVDAGWCFDPSPEAEDGVTCFYCNLSLDGWEPKDSPMDEHRRRSSDCPFFSLLEHYGSTRTTAKGKRGRASNASRTSRLSTQSMQSTFSEAPSLMSLGDAGMYTDVDESIAIDTTITSDAGTTKGRKKATKAKATGKARNKTKKDESVEPSVIEQPYKEPAVEEEPYVEPQPEPEAAPESEPEPEIEQAPDPAEAAPKPTRGRKAKRADESQLEDPSVMEVDPPAKAKKTRGRPKKVETPPPRVSQDESQLQSELQDAASFASALQSPPTKITKGVKRTSDGVEKAQEPVVELVEEEPVKPKKAARAAKPKKGKKATKDAREDSEMVSATVDESTEVATSQQEVKPKRGRKPKKVQEEAPAPEPSVPEVEVEMDEAAEEQEQQQANPEFGVEMSSEMEREIEAEYEALAQEVAEGPEVEEEAEEDVHHEGAPAPEAQFDIQKESEGQQEAEEDDTAVYETPNSAASHLTTPAEEEFEVTPTPQKPRHSSERIPSSAHQATPRAVLEKTQDSETASPQSSDAENRPPSSSSHLGPPPSTVKKSHSVPNFSASEKRPAPALALMDAIELFPSPVKATSRIPLAPGTPTHNRSPSKAQMSPSKRLGTLTSTTSWDPVDLETVFFSSPEKENLDARGVEEKLALAGGVLTAQELKMSVEEWVRWRAEQGEGKLKKECERLVGLFEKEGGRAMEVLMGIRTAS